MMKSDVVNAILGERKNVNPSHTSVNVFAPTNIALCKYWGKRNQELNLPVTSSLSISLGKKGTTTELRVSNTTHDVVILNHQPVDHASHFYKRLISFLDLFRTHHSLRFYIDTQSNIPTAAGLASSASGFAALVQALNELFKWELKQPELSILARLGSGSACRSIWPGFVEWHAGIREDGMDSYGEAVPTVWPELCIGLLIVNHKEKHIGSREAMQCTVDTSPFYVLWPEKVNNDLIAIKEAINVKNFDLLGKTSESNAMAMHATMLSAWPPISYILPETVIARQKIWESRHQGLSLYFTQDAGPNLKLLFMKKDADLVRSFFSNIEILQPFQQFR